MTKDEALKLALEALEEAWYHVGTFQPTEKAIDLYDEARTAIKEALAQPEHDYKDLYEKEKRKSAMWLAKYEEIAGPAPKAIPMAQPEQEPVAWIYKGEKSFDGNKYSDEYELTASKQVALWKDKDAKPLYTTPPQRTWVGLTNEERAECWETIPELAMRKVEAKLKEKNG